MNNSEKINYIINSNNLDVEKINTWPFREAKRILERIKRGAVKNNYILFETGYGPSGLPHIGTFGEVVRTNMVRRAFSTICNYPTKLIIFSDDMDGLRKVPDNVPRRDLLDDYIGVSLTNVPDPFNLYDSFGQYNNAKLRSFLDSFSFDYEFLSSTECYKSGLFDKELISVFENYEEIMSIVLPSLREERKKTYSPFLPICQTTKRVLQVPIIERNINSKTIIYQDPKSKKLVETMVTRGFCKLQWKVDWAMRWKAFGVDYEMSGKDLIDSVKLSGKILRILGGINPENFTYELFLDKNGEKISKTKGNGISIEEWLQYAPEETLAYYMFKSPQKCRRLHFDIIPKTVDEYLEDSKSYLANRQWLNKINNPIWYISGEDLLIIKEVPIRYSMILNLASVCNPDNKNILLGFIKKYIPYSEKDDIENNHLLNSLIQYAINYYFNFIHPNKIFQIPNAYEREALKYLANELQNMPIDSKENDIQSLVFYVGKKYGFDGPNLYKWFNRIYEILLGQKEGPRIGSFIVLFGIQNTIDLINKKTKI